MSENNGIVKAKLSPLSLGLAFGIVEGLYMLLFSWAGSLWGYGTTFIGEIANVFYGYAPTFVGGLIGGLWGFVDGFIFGIIVAWIYNCCLCCCCRKSVCTTDKKNSQ